jgi:multidrug efflux pump subunit AcrA (membrane-fusion protein)
MNMKNRRVWLILLLVALVAGGSGYAYYARTVGAAQAEAEPAVQTTVARRGNITVSATGAGTVMAAEEIELGFTTSGRLTEMLVRVGDRVEAGDVLARVDDRSAQEALANAQLQLAQAAMQSDASSTETGISYDEISVAQAQINLDQAQAERDALLNWAVDPDEVALLEANVVAAEAAYNAANGQAAASSSSIAVSAISVDQAERNLASVQEAYDTAWDSARDWELNDPFRADMLKAEREGTAEALLRAQEALRVAELNYNATAAGSSSSGIANSQTSLLSAQQALAEALAGPAAEEIEAAEIAVRQAELSYQQALLNQEANAISLAQAELEVASAEGAVDGTALIAPIAGTVTAVNFDVGENASGTVIVLADLEQPLLEVYLDESDMGMVGMDYEVEVVFDALPEETFTGRIVQIDPTLVNSNGVSAVRALVQLDADSFAKPQTLPVGLNGTAEVIGGRAQNAVIVPVEALREIGDGEYAVFVMEEGEPRLRMVEVGLMDFTFVEITAGLEEGEIVTTGIVETE